jgi:hypothetical protein
MERHGRFPSASIFVVHFFSTAMLTAQCQRHNGKRRSPPGKFACLATLATHAYFLHRMPALRRKKESPGVFGSGIIVSAGPVATLKKE